MPILVLSLFGFVRLLLSGHVAIAMENAALRVQLVAFQPKRKRPTLTSFDRLFWVGLSLLWTGCVACLVLDLKMPGMNGLEVQRVVSVQISTAIIFITGRGDIPSTVKAMQGGAVDFLTKPIDEAVLMAAVEQVLQRTELPGSKPLKMPTSSRVTVCLLPGRRNCCRHWYRAY